MLVLNSLVPWQFLQVRNISDLNYKEDIIMKRLKELAFLNSGITIHFINDVNGKKVKYYYEGGLKEYISEILNNRKYCDELIYIPPFIKGDNSIESSEMDYFILEQIMCYTNNIYQKDGGTHLGGFKFCTYENTE